MSWAKYHWVWKFYKAYQTDCKDGYDGVLIGIADGYCSHQMWAMHGGGKG